ncbi:hypothetical protein [Streptomyces iconiensis]|uniref:Uncharacterized protein n=1 Tax=Streptomyces iconiensis TaxID=1384038 RepID=A0ABT7A6S1_9ACTN|nr:hypothetical protein [Streptomyces iconiensis]MDJ1137009.1 hypothetical protein [Streptomyces iconiensis]
MRVRTLFNGEFGVDYGQLYIDSRGDPDEGPEDGLHECFMGQRAGLCGAAVPGHLFLLTGTHTGSVPLTVELHDAEPPLDAGDWEEIVEVSFRTGPEDTELIEWDGGGQDLGLPQGEYRVRYHCRGMDEARDGVRSAGEPVVDEYLLRFWPGPAERDRVVKETSGSAAYWHGFASELPPAPTAEELAEARRLAREKEEREERERRERSERKTWGGRLPSERLRNAGGNVAGMVRFDAALVHAIDELGPDVQRAVARWAAHRACDVAGLGGVDWIARGLAELDRGEPFSPPLDDERRKWDLLFSDPQVPDTVITTPDGTPNASQQAMALPAVTEAAAVDPLQAALDALFAAATAHGSGWRGFLAQVRSAFPETAHAPLPAEDYPQRGFAVTIRTTMEWRPDDEPRQAP